MSGWGSIHREVERELEQAENPQSAKSPEEIELLWRNRSEWEIRAEMERRLAARPFNFKPCQE